jgi:flagellar biosynthesis/type III secretory pathway protein FliH
MYDQREKAQRDYEWALSGAREEGERVGLEKGERLGLEKGERLGAAKGERLGLEKGELLGKIQLLQELLGSVPSSIEELRACETSELEVRLAALQQQLRDRQV